MMTDVQFVMSLKNGLFPLHKPGIVEGLGGATIVCLGWLSRLGPHRPPGDPPCRTRNSDPAKSAVRKAIPRGVSNSLAIYAGPGFELGAVGR